MRSICSAARPRALEISLAVCAALLLLLALSAQARADETAAAPGAPSATPAQVDAFAADPVVVLAAHRRCSSRTVVITPSYSVGAPLKYSTVFVNGRRIQTLTDSGAVFQLGVRRFKAGRNNYEVVSVFANGKSASRLGHFTRCSKRRAR